MLRRTQNHRNGNARWALITAMIWSGVLIQNAHSQPCSPFTAFQALTPAELAALQVKLAYVGLQNKAIPSIGFTSPTQVFNPSLFVPFRNPTVDYSNDSVAIRTFTASVQELQSVIDNVATLPSVTAGGLNPDQFLSFAMVTTGGKCFEAVLNDVDTAALFTKLRLALQSNPTGLARLTELGCPLTVLDPMRPTDVSGQMTVTLSGVRVDRATGLFVGFATVKNTLASSVSGPISLVLNLTGNVRLANGIGTTCGTLPAGVGFIDLPGALPAGGTAEVKVAFSNPDAQPIMPTTTKVLAGPGAR